MKILDATCGMKSIWYQKDLPFVTFIDKRSGCFPDTTSSRQKLTNRRTIRVDPDMILDWTNALPFESSVFDLVVFDPPHLFKSNGDEQPIIKRKYGYLDRMTWRSDIRNGFVELFRVLADNGFLVLKWCEVDINLSEILKLCPYDPLFGSRTGTSNRNHWVLFAKHRANQTLSDFDGNGV